MQINRVIEKITLTILIFCIENVIADVHFISTPQNLLQLPRAYIFIYILKMIFKFQLLAMSNIRIFKRFAMAHRFGEFFLEPQWPSENDENDPHFIHFRQEEQQDANLPKQPNSKHSSQRIKFQELQYSAEIGNSMVFIKQQDKIYESSQQIYEQDEGYDENIPSTYRVSPTNKEPKGEHENIKQKPRIKDQDNDDIPSKSLIKRNKKQVQRGKYKILSEELKKQIVEETKNMTMVQVARKYHVSVNNICRWRKRCDRRLGAGRKVTDMDMQRKLLDWLMTQNHPIPRKQVQATARRMSRQQGFKASKGWFQRFYKRNKLHYNPNIQILTHNDYKLRISQSMCQHGLSREDLQMKVEQNPNSKYEQIQEWEQKQQQWEEEGEL